MSALGGSGSLVALSSTNLPGPDGRSAPAVRAMSELRADDACQRPCRRDHMRLPGTRGASDSRLAVLVRGASF